MMLDMVSYLREHEEIKIISLDVFDTLLFRTAYTPSDVFGKMYEFEPEAFPEGVSQEDWLNARRTAEGTARKKKNARSGNYEVILKDIYRELPTVFTDREPLMRLEVETEKRCCFLNVPLYEEVKKAADFSGCQIVLCSDMYLDGGTILSILEQNGFDLSLVGRIFVSCEWEASKRQEGLFRRLLEECGAKPQEVLHVGDDYYRDVGVARHLGLHALHYNFISDACYRHPFLKLEELSHGSVNGIPCNELYVLRLTASERGSGLSAEERFWHDIGAMIYGPFLTYAAEWVLDQAKGQNIKRIRPFMREGDFLCRMLKRAAGERGGDFSVEPLYVSRFAIFRSLFGQITAKEVEYFIGTYHIRVRDVFENLHIEDLAGDFEAFRDVPVNELRNVAMGECSAYTALLEYLTSPEMLSRIRERNAGKAEWMLKYFEKRGLFEPCVTLDLGWRGTMQKALDDVFEAHGIENHMRHLLCICSPLAVSNVVDGSRIWGYMGNFGKHQNAFSQLSARLFELALLSKEGTTVSYQRSEDGGEPVVSHIPYPDWQVGAMKQLQEGILAFQSVYLETVKKKPYLKRLGERPELLAGLVGRLHAFPLYEEAKRLSSLVYDQNFGANTFTPILGERTIHAYKGESFEDFYGKRRDMGLTWYSGLNALGENRLFYAEAFLQQRRRFSMLSVACLTGRVLRERGDRALVLVQAGNMTKFMLQFLAIAGSLDVVAGIVDNDPSAVGTRIGGIEIYPVEHEFQNPLYVFTTVREECRRAISGQLKDLFGSEIPVMGRMN